MINNILLAGISYKKTPIELRERLSFSGNNITDTLLKLKSHKFVDECIILSTCNRIEFYCVTESIEDCLADLNNFIIYENNFPQEYYTTNFYFHYGENAVKHLLRVSSSLDSMVIGEPQILGQVKEQYRRAHEAGTTGLILNRLFHNAFFTAKKVRSETGIGAQAISISYAAVELAKRIFDDLHNRSALLIGSGEMGELAAKNLINAGINELFITSRNYNNAEILAQKLGGRAIRNEELYFQLNHTDIVISATDSVEFIIGPQHLKEALKIRKNEPVFLIDIAVPRDIDPRVEDIENVYLYDIDDLKSVSEENIKTRREKSRKAEDIINQRVDIFIEWLNQLKVFPTIVELKGRFEHIKNIELSKALRRIENTETDSKEILDNLANSIVSKLLHQPITKLKGESSSSLSALYIETLRKLFNLDRSLAIVEDDMDIQLDQDWNKGQ